MFYRSTHVREASGRHGNILAIVAISLVALMGIAGLVTDGNQLMAERRHAQNAADAAAMAASIDLLNGKSATTAKAAGC